MITHRTQKGETLSAIRKKYGLSFVPYLVIQKLNPQIKDINKIQIGWKIKLPSSYAELKAIQKIEPPQKSKLFRTYGLSSKLSPEEILKQRSLYWEKQLSFLERVGKKISLTVGGFLKGESPKIIYLKEKVMKRYPVTKMGKILIKKMDVTGVDLGPTTAGEWTPRGLVTKKTSLQEIIAKIQDTFRIGPEALYLNPEEDKIKLAVRRDSTLMHEILHANFSKEILRPFGSKGINAFIKSWETAKKNYPAEIGIIDETIKTRYPDFKWDNKAHERYAWFGAVFGKAGLDKFPPSLKIWYSGILK